MAEDVKRVFVSGCYDPIHAGHIKFFETASSYGELYVCIGSDRTIEELKRRKPHTTEQERIYHLGSIKHIHEVLVGSGKGLLDFEPELRKVKPDIFIVNKDGDHESKRNLCNQLSLEYLVLERVPNPGLPERNSTDLRNKSKMPYRIDLAGGWLDQPYVSKYCPGPVITISIAPTHEFNLRSGMASSTREKAIKLWGNREPPEDEESAKMLFGYENPPGIKEVAGSQDSIGIVFSGLNRLDYESGEYWPRTINSIHDDTILNWLESVIHLIPLNPRGKDFEVLSRTNINETDAKNLSLAAKNCFDAILQRDVHNLGKFVRKSYEAQIKMFPLMTNPEIDAQIRSYQEIAKGWKISGAGGGGYLTLISDVPIENSIKIKIRRKNQ